MPKKIKEHYPTLRCKHITKSWQQKDGKMFKHKKSIVQICAVCYALLDSGVELEALVGDDVGCIKDNQP